MVTDSDELREWVSNFCNHGRHDHLLHGMVVDENGDKKFSRSEITGMIIGMIQCILLMIAVPIYLLVFLAAVAGN